MTNVILSEAKDLIQLREVCKRSLVKLGMTSDEEEK